MFNIHCSILFNPSLVIDYQIKILQTCPDVALNNISFSNSEKLGGGYTLSKTTFTASSLVGSTSGTPIDTRLFKQYNSEGSIVSDARALGDVLKSNGYNLEIMQGSDIRFASEGVYFKKHGDFKIFDNLDN